MKARVKATGEIVNVKAKTYIANSRWDVGIRYVDIDGNIYYEEDLDFENIIEGKADVKEKSFPKDEPDYWDKLHHQAAIDFMKSFLDKYDGTVNIESLLSNAIKLATALVNRLKEDKS